MNSKFKGLKSFWLPKLLTSSMKSCTKWEGHQWWTVRCLQRTDAEKKYQYQFNHRVAKNDWPLTWKPALNLSILKLLCLALLCSCQLSGNAYISSNIHLVNAGLWSGSQSSVGHWLNQLIIWIIMNFSMRACVFLSVGASGSRTQLQNITSGGRTSSNLSLVNTFHYGRLCGFDSVWSLNVSLYPEVSLEPMWGSNFLWLKTLILLLLLLT